MSITASITIMAGLFLLAIAAAYALAKSPPVDEFGDEAVHPDIDSLRDAA